MRLQDSIDIISFSEGDLLRYNLEGNPEVRYGVVEEDCHCVVGTDDGYIVRMWKQSTVPFGERKEGAYLQNIHENLGQITFKDYMYDNPERFI